MAVLCGGVPVLPGGNAAGEGPERCQNAAIHVAGNPGDDPPPPSGAPRVPPRVADDDDGRAAQQQAAQQRNRINNYGLDQAALDRTSYGSLVIKLTVWVRLFQLAHLTGFEKWIPQIIKERQTARI